MRIHKHYLHVNLREEIVIRKLYSFHYTELSKDYVYPGEKHNSWEFLYVDKGELQVTTDNGVHQLKQGEIVFYAPNEFHALNCNRTTPPNIFIVCFDCRSEAMHHFTGRSLRLINDERSMLSVIIEEGQRSFVPNTRSDRLRRTLDKASTPYFGSEQLVKIYLEALFIRLIRRGLKLEKKTTASAVSKDKEETGIASRIKQYLDDNWSEPLTLDHICAEFSFSKTHLDNLFLKHTGCRIMEFTRRLKIEKAKMLIREETYSVSEIAERVGYSSIHYFSRQFKKMTGVSPTEYLKMIKTNDGASGSAINGDKTPLTITQRLRIRE